MSDEPTRHPTPAQDRRSMDPHLSRLERRLDVIDDVLRGDTTGHPGIVESVRQLSNEQRRQGEELALLRAVPAQLEELTRSSASRDERFDKVGDKVDELVLAASTAKAIAQGERLAVEKISSGLKVAAGLLAVLLAGGGASVVALLRQLAEVAQALP